MRTIKKALVKARYVWLCAVLLLTFGARTAAADAISDVLTVSDTMGFSMTMQLRESQEPGGKLSIRFPGRVLDLTDSGGAQLSDILTIPAFTVTLSSDGNTAGGAEPPEPGPFPFIQFKISANSGVNTPLGVSDILTVNALTASIPESVEPFTVRIALGARSVPFGGGGDTLSIGAFTVELVSLGELPGGDGGESITDTITISAASDVPEPSTLALLALGLAGVGAQHWLRRTLQVHPR